MNDHPSLGPPTPTVLLDRGQIVPATGFWGVYDLHTREWLAAGLPDARQSWAALIELPNLHPWELRVAQADKSGQPILAKPDCGTCEGSGDCQHCHGDGLCPDCDGSGEEPE